MLRGLYTAGIGMMTQMKRMDVVSGNIANVNTTGYKKDNVVTRTFSEELTKQFEYLNSKEVKSVGKFSTGLFVDDVYTDFTSGGVKVTEGPLDLALSGDGFFVVRVKGDDGKNTEMYTRDGSFTLGSDNTLLTKEGNTVLGQNGPIKIPNGVITIEENGRVMSNGTYVDTLRMTNFEDLHTLRKTKDNLYTTTESKQKAFTGKVVQGALEASNVNPVREMVDMITISRNYDANQRVISAYDASLNRSVNDVGRR